MPTLRLSHGPLRLPVDGFNPLPFFGTIPLALLRRRDRLEPAGPAGWAAVARSVDTGLSLARRGTLPEDERLGEWLLACAEGGVLNWRESAQACLGLIKSLFDDDTLQKACGLPTPDQWTDVEYWYVKEGHTSSVWRLAISLRDSNRPRLYCVNIARDRDAATELALSAQILRELRAHDTRHVASVHFIDEIRIPPLDLKTTVTIGEWICGNELHLRRVVGSDRSHPEVFEISWFVGSSGSDGAQRALGRRLGTEEIRALQKQWLEFLERHAVVSPDAKRIELPEIDFDHGDVVWADGCMVIVAAGTQRRTILAEDWSHIRKNAAACWRWPAHF